MATYEFRLFEARDCLCLKQTEMSSWANCEPMQAVFELRFELEWWLEVTVKSLVDQQFAAVVVVFVSKTASFLYLFRMDSFCDC